MVGIRKSPHPYSIPEQMHDVLITNSQTYSIRLSMLCLSGVITPDNKFALSNERFVSMIFFSFGLLFCVIFEESLLKLCPTHHVDPYQFHSLNSVITLSLRRMALSNFIILLNLKPCNLHLNSVRLIFRCNIY